MKKNKIPFSFIPFNVLKKISSVFYGLGSKTERNIPSLKLNIEKAEIGASAEDYVAMCLMSSLIFFIFSYILLGVFLFIFVGKFLLLSLIIAFPLTLFVFLQQILYPKLVAGRKIKDVERNLLPALQDMLVQLNSGVSLFRIMVNISNEKYGAISKEFQKAVKKINVGIPQIEVLDEMASKNPSLYFRRAIWQLVNGMKTGADPSLVVKNIIATLSEEQLIQVQKYGGQLNPLAMFYMLATVIMPSLGITFLIIIFSFVPISGFLLKLIFWGLYMFVVFFQIMFLGIIKTKRPTLLER